MTGAAGAMRLMIVTDAWAPQVNGVVRTLERVALELGRGGVDVTLLTPADHATVALPSYPEVRLAVTTPGAVARRIDALAPDRIHIATEGPLGVFARRHALRSGRPFTTSYHTRFPEYVSARLPLPERWTYSLLRRFHNAGRATMVATRSLSNELAGRGFTRLASWSRGVDTEQFDPARRRTGRWPGPVFLTVGRVAVEKNLTAFLDLDLPGTKLVVGDGPQRAWLQARYPDAVFLGTRTGDELADIYACADVFVFPSRTDTFGNVLLEALASGLPVAAFPVTGPLDVICDGADGALSQDLRSAALRALTVDRQAPRVKALAHTWQGCASQFLGHVQAAV